MDTVFLVFPESRDEPVGVADIADRLAPLDVTRYPTALAVSSGSARAYVDPVPDPSTIELYDDWPPAQVPSGPASVYAVRYRDPELVVRAVHLLARHGRVLVDTDNDLVVDGSALTRDMLPRG